MRLPPDEQDIAVSAMIQRARIAASQLQHGRIPSTEGISLDSIIDTWEPLLEKIQLFSRLAEGLSEVRSISKFDTFCCSFQPIILFKVHPYAATAYNVIAAAYKVRIEICH